MLSASGCEAPDPVEVAYLGGESGLFGERSSPIALVDVVAGHSLGPVQDHLGGAFTVTSELTDCADEAAGAFRVD